MKSTDIYQKMVSMNRLKHKLARLGILQEEIDACKSVKDLNKLNAKFLKENVNSDGTNPEGK